MLEQTDAQLLRDYAEHRNEAAFRELVSRHADVIYASALRQVTSPDLAQDIAQSVFTDLARKAQTLAGTLTGDASLLGWLYRSTRFLALNQMRDDRRRQARERHAMQHFDPAAETAPEWERVQPVLDEAMADLSDEDRDALLLRFFKNRDFRAIGAALGVSDDAAQKRVSRALERLRTQFTSRGVSTTAVALSAVLSSNAVPLAPASLAATLSSAALAGASVTATAVATATEGAVMTLTQKLLVATIVVASVIPPALVQQCSRMKLAAQDSALQQQADRLSGLQNENKQLADLLAQADSSRSLPAGQFSELLRLRGQIGRLNREVLELTQLKAASSVATTNQLAATEKLWSERADQLRRWLEANSTGKIPELQFLSDQDWIESIHPLTLGSDMEYRRAMSNVRANAESRVLDLLHGALRQYGQAHNGQFPTELSHLAPYFRTPIDDSILNRYEIVRAESLVRELQLGEDWVITQKAPVDEEWDVRLTISLTNGGMADCTVTNRWRQTN